MGERLGHTEPEVFEPDPLYPDDDFLRVGGIIYGSPFNRTLCISNVGLPLLSYMTKMVMHF